MPITPNIGGQTAGRLAQAMLADAQQKRSMGMALREMALNEQNRKKARMFDLLQQRAAMKQQEKMAKAQEPDTPWGALGGGVGGAALGALLAVPTGGLSVAAGAMLGGGIGSTAGGAFDQSPQVGANLGRTMMYATEYMPSGSEWDRWYGRGAGPWH